MARFVGILLGSIGLLVAVGCQANYSNIAEAICANSQMGLKAFLESGHDPSELIVDPSFKGPPLVLTVDDPGCGKPLNSVALISILLDYGADVNAATAGGRTALMAAVSSSNVEAVKTLVEHGAFVNQKDIEGRPALMYISSNPDVLPAVKYLIAHGADPNIRSTDGVTAAQAASKMRNRLVAEYLQTLKD